MRRLKVGIEMGLQGCHVEDEIEVEDDATPDQIDKEVREWAFQHVQWWHEEL